MQIVVSLDNRIMDNILMFSVISKYKKIIL